MAREISDHRGNATPSRIENLTKHRWFAPLTLIIIVLIGSYFRLADLGMAALRADEGFFMNLCRQDTSPVQIFKKWTVMQNLSGQLPFAAALTKGFVSILHLPVNHFTVHLPSALWGIAAILAAYGAGRAFAGVAFGLAMALMLALNPYHIQVSREAYYYAPLVCGSFLGLWSILWTLDVVRGKASVTPLFYVVHILGFFLLTYSQTSGWPLGLVLSVTVVVGFVLPLLKQKRLSRPYLYLMIAFLVIGLPLLLCEWGLKQQMQASTAEVRAAVTKIFGVNPIWSALWSTATSYGWGRTPVRASFTALALILGLAVCVRNVRTDKRFLLPWLLMIAGFLFAYFSLRARGTPLMSRYVVALMPLYLTIIVTGLMRAEDLFPHSEEKPPNRWWLRAIPVGIAALLWVAPAYACTQLTGIPTPYKDINAWVDANLPKGTLVLVDRWFEPWCELKDEPATNVFYTYTIPDEPLGVYTQMNWRATATNFFATNPDAAYLEVSKHFWDNPAVGPWDWPSRFFAHRVSFTNQAGMKLREWGLANREDFYAPHTNRVIVDVYYNTREDVLAKAKAAGQSCLALFGEGWGYIKAKDHRDWRVLHGDAQIDLYNLTAAPTNVLVSIMGVSVGGGKQIQLAKQVSCRFEADTIGRCQFHINGLPPGHTSLTVRDDLWPLIKVPLAVQELTVSPLSNPPSGDIKPPSP